MFTFSFWCSLTAVVFAVFAVKEYRFTAYLVAIEFSLHYIVYNFLFFDLRAQHTGVIFLLYAIIQVFTLSIIYNIKTHFIIALLIFSDLAYNFFTILHHIGLTEINFHGSRKSFARTIMILELIYLLGIVSYVRNYLREHRIPDIDYVDNLFRVRWWDYNRSIS